MNYEYITVKNQRDRNISYWNILADGKIEHSGTLDRFGLEQIEHRKKYWRVIYKGYLYSMTAGLYSFYGYDNL